MDPLPEDQREPPQETLSRDLEESIQNQGTGEEGPWFLSFSSSN